jgi:hypothetical protein
MRVCIRAIVTIGLLTIATAGQVSAQTPAQRPRGRFRIGLNAGAQPSTISFAASTTRPVYLENSVVDTAYRAGKGPLFDGNASVRIAGSFGVGIAVSWFSKKDDASINAAIPHPFFFNAARSIDGTASGLRRDELVTHLQAVYSIRPTRRIDVALTAGPSFFRVTQAFVYDVSYGETYPYDTATLTAALSKRVSGHKTGFNAGADVGLRVSRNIGVGGLVRFSKAEMQFVLPNGVTSAKSDAGGIHAAGGVRFYF